MNPWDKPEQQQEPIVCSEEFSSSVWYWNPESRRKIYVEGPVQFSKSRQPPLVVLGQKNNTEIEFEKDKVYNFDHQEVVKLEIPPNMDTMAVRIVTQFARIHCLISHASTSFQARN
eukprot:GHVP01029576.1.p1 GENE.GHVP01029576.1~~GHVP01029576.1.p1  ORF type:complete len:116 (-),score=21.77 GHVP01029576.1:169-516(-)